MRRLRCVLATGVLVLAGLMRADGPVSGTVPDRLPALRVSENRRFLVEENGAPFFWLADTAWELFHRLDREEADHYLRRRAAQGFTVIQAVVLAELDGLGDPNPYGHLPLVDRDPERPDEAYFGHVDWIIGRANRLGLRIGLLPTWGDKWNKKWGVGPEIFTPANAAAYGRWLGKRYREAGVVWILGGDRPVESDSHREIQRAMARGLREGDGGRHLITWHPSGGAGSAQYFHGEPWLDFNLRQNGHEGGFTGRYDQTAADHDRTPVLPVIDGEPLYEDHPLSFDAARRGHSVAADVRRPLYWDLFQGACGHTYGHHSVWQMWAPPRKPVNLPLMSWKEALDQPGAGQMRHARDLLESRTFLNRIPDPGLIVPDAVPTRVPGAGVGRFVATRADDGGWGMVYAPVGRAFRVRLDRLSGEEIRAWWFNPRDGTARVVGVFPRRGEREFRPPTPGEALDWVLVLDDVGRGFSTPGRRP